MSVIDKILFKIKQIAYYIAYGPKSTPEKYAAYLREQGVLVGQGTHFFDPKSTIVDVTRPYLVEFGKNVMVPANVTILTHGYDVSVIHNKYECDCGSAGKVKIGDNVFIGTGSIILKGVTIGNNVVIAAGSVVNKSIPDNCVAGGNPAEVLMDIETYFEKRKAAQLSEATELAVEYHRRTGKKPDDYIMREHVWMYSKNRRRKNSPEPMFENLEDFLKHCGIE